jgi:hypothetical protein
MKKTKQHCEKNIGGEVMFLLPLPARKPMEDIFEIW